MQNGGYQYTAPDGQVVSVQYTADENGFHAVGDHIPTTAAPSPEIQKALELIYEGIRKNAEKNAERAKTDPAYAKSLEARAEADYNGQYYPLD